VFSSLLDTLILKSVIIAETTEMAECCNVKQPLPWNKFRSILDIVESDEDMFHESVS